MMRRVLRSACWGLACWLLAVSLLAASLLAEDARLQVGGATIDVTFGPGEMQAGKDSLLKWVSNAANAVSTYFGRFPVQHPRLMIRPEEGRGGVFHGTTFGGRQGAFTRISLGQSTAQKQLDDDWTMTHEFIHMAFPDLSGESDGHHWMEEGMATYIEPIARAEIGRMTPERVWGDFVRDMPQGLPQAGDQGLDRTPIWGRTYWGGAIFWLLADVGIREATHNQKGLRDAMRGILEAGGNITEDWIVERVAQVGDQATGTTGDRGLVPADEGDAMPTDLDDLWRRMGVQVKNRAVTFDHRAPLAGIRNAITAK